MHLVNIVLRLVSCGFDTLSQPKKATCKTQILPMQSWHKGESVGTGVDEVVEGRMFHAMWASV